MIRSESTKAFGQPRLTKLTRGAGIWQAFCSWKTRRINTVSWACNHCKQLGEAEVIAGLSMPGRESERGREDRPDLQHAAIDHVECDIEDDQQADIGDPAVMVQQPRDI